MVLLLHWLLSHEATESDHGLVFPVGIGVGKVLRLRGMDRRKVTDPRGPHLGILHLASAILRRRPAEAILSRDGRNHHFHLGPDGLVRGEVVVLHQDFPTLAAGHAGFRVVLALLRVEVDGDGDAQLVPLHLLGLHSDSFRVVVDAGDGRVVVAAGFAREAAAPVRVLGVLAHRGPEAVL